MTPRAPSPPSNMEVETLCSVIAIKVVVFIAKGINTYLTH